MRKLRHYLISSIERRLVRIAELEEQIPQVEEDDQYAINEVIIALQSQIVAYEDVLRRLPNQTESLYESQCKYCQYFDIINGVATCTGSRMDEELFEVGTECMNFKYRENYL